ncbi:hypothetical protein GCM10010218_59290 [Streptomyces mashuensis]|uniref:Integral membrane protein n=1 Tax=Streptomyces mashuensis TaxID=33904 RepID=A0A919EF51_9ACTN|nr:hypothetical protein [Streptomyces mashuensis]GHF70094.1 hypothetical protein GCM10010218_59290 [Streptomyces mashuensis]
MRATKTATKALWRWRRNPLRRRSDALEAWTGVAAVVLMLLLGTAAGWSAGARAHQALQHTVREQQRHRHAVSATAVRLLPGSTDAPGREPAAGRDGYRRVLARWPGPDGRERTGAVAVRQALAPGGRFALWTDEHGRASSRPLDAGTATAHAVLAGLAAAGAAAGLVEGARRLAVRRLVRQRYQQWDRAWQLAGETWGRADTGS